MLHQLGEIITTSSLVRIKGRLKDLGICLGWHEAFALTTRHPHQRSITYRGQARIRIKFEQDATPHSKVIFPPLDVLENLRHATAEVSEECPLGKTHWTSGDIQLKSSRKPSSSGHRRRGHHRNGGLKNISNEEPTPSSDS